MKSVEKIVQTVNNMGAVPWVYYISFDYDAMKKVRELSPAAPVAFLGGDKSPEELAADKIGADCHQGEFDKKPDFIEKARKLGVSVCVWTVNSGEAMDRFIKQEVDYITTDEPELLLSKNAQTCGGNTKK